jgi:hypothetical protein
MKKKIKTTDSLKKIKITYIILFSEVVVIQARLDPFLPIDITLNPMA